MLRGIMHASEKEREETFRAVIIQYEARVR